MPSGKAPTKIMIFSLATESRISQVHVKLGARSLSYTLALEDGLQVIVQSISMKLNGHDISLNGRWFPEVIISSKISNVSIITLEITYIIINSDIRVKDIAAFPESPGKSRRL
jgi:hypothetical protein